MKLDKGISIAQFLHTAMKRCPSTAKRLLIFNPIRLVALFLTLVAATGEASPVPDLPAGVRPGSAQSGAPAQFLLDISTQQIVNQPLLVRARILILDENNALVTNYDLAANPITLAVSRGSLSTAVINNQSRFSGGIVDLLADSITYRGTSGTISWTATAGSVSSPPALVSYSGFDILGAFDFRGTQITTIYSSLPTSVSVVVQNQGNLLPVSQSILRTSFLSGGGSLQIFIPPSANGFVDTAATELPTDNLFPGVDSLLIRIESSYSLGGQTRTTIDSLTIPVIVLPSLQITAAPGSFGVDSVYPGIPFQCGVDIVISGLQTPVDSAQLVIGLANTVGGAIIDTLFEGTPRNSSLAQDTVRYRSIQVQTNAETVTGRAYPVKIDYQLFTGGNLVRLSDQYPFSLFVVPPVSLSYQIGTLDPLVAVAGREESFSFSLFSPSATMLEVLSQTALFTLSGDGFSATTQFQLAGNLVVPGANSITTEGIFLPAERAGELLAINAQLQYRQSGVDNALSFETAFGGTTVEVIPIARIKVISAELIAPNRPAVNTGQAVTIRSRIANVSAVASDTFSVRLSSLDQQNQSTIPGELVIDSIAPFDTVTIDIPVTAALVPKPDQEILRLDVVSEAVDRDPPIDNIETLLVQTPAQLSLLFSLSLPPDNRVDANSQFTLAVLLQNSGQADVSDVQFRLSTGGLDFGVTDPFEANLVAGQNFALALRAPNLDTAVTLNATLLGVPLDLNTGNPALLDRSSFSVPLTVIRSQPALRAEVTRSPIPLLVPNVEQPLFGLQLTSVAVIDNADITVDSLLLVVRDQNGQVLSPWQVLREGSLRISSSQPVDFATELVNNRLLLRFTGLSIAPDLSLPLSLFAIVEPSIAQFTLTLDSADLYASFLGGAQPGIRTPILISEGDGRVVTANFLLSTSQFSNSLRLRKNPVNLTMEAAEIAFYPPAADRLLLSIHSLTGELVLERVVTQAEWVSASNGTLGVIRWDGRNDRSVSVQNGVYLISLRDESSGTIVSTRIAVYR